MSQQTESPTIILGESNLVRPVEQQSEPAKMVEQGNPGGTRPKGRHCGKCGGAHKTRAHTKKLTDADGVQAAEYQVIEDIVQATEAL